MAAIERLWCIVAAAGSGRRFGAEIPKQYLPLGGKPMLEMHARKACRMPLKSAA